MRQETPDHEARLPRNLQFPVTLAALLVVLSTALLGLWQPVDNMLRGYRFAVATSPATQTTAFVDIDGKSLNGIGTWPWKRRVYADLIEKLIAADAAEIVVDIDFSVSSDPEDDAILEKALEDAGGYVLLASFLQPSSIDGQMQLNFPIPRFAKNADPVFVNVPTDDDGIVRNYVLGEKINGEDMASVAAALVPGYEGKRGAFGIDFGINIQGIERLSMIDILDGSADTTALAGKQVIVGASALELRDIYAVPRYGLMPGSILHALAAETLRQGRAMQELPVSSSVVLSLLLAGVLMMVLQRAPVLAGTACAILISFSVEAGAFLLQQDAALLTSTSVIHASQIVTGLIALGFQLNQKGTLLALTRRAHTETQTVLKRVISDNFDGVVVADARGIILTASQMAEDMLCDENTPCLAGLHVAEVLPAALSEKLIAALDGESDSASARRQEMQFDWLGAPTKTIEYVITVSDRSAGKGGRRKGEGRIACLTFSDVTERRAGEERLLYLATHDLLTGAVSRSQLIEQVITTMTDDKRRQVGITMFLLSLSRFKVIQDSLGHSYGDLLLKQLVARLKAAEFDVVARLGDDSFALVRAGVLTQTGIDATSNSLIARVTEAYDLGQHRATVGVKIGVTTSEVTGVDPEMLISHADMALSEAKSQPGNVYAVYSRDMDEHLRERQDMEVALRLALQLKQFHVLFQPQVDLQTGDLVSVETLARWTHPRLGPISPARFVPIAEDTGAIFDIGRWILKTACEEAVKWQGNVTVAVNVSPVQFEFGDVVGDVREVLAETGLKPERLEIEITEGVLISNSETIISALQTLQRMGVQIALDDFGTGYSSLSYLGRLPVDKIKIDQSFVRGLPRDEQSGAIIRAIMTLSKSLGKIVVAEGIENADQAWMLRLSGAEIGQGYHFSRPLPPAEMAARIARLEQTESRYDVG